MTTTSDHRSSPVTSRVLLCTDQPAPLRDLLADDESPLEIDVAETSAAALERIGQRAFDVCLLDVNCSEAACADLAARIQSMHSSCQLVRLSIAAEKCSATISLPIEVISPAAPPALVRKLLRSVAQRARLQAENRSLRRQLQARVTSDIIGQSGATCRLRDAIVAAADADDCVLIQGAAGAGARHVARVVHLASRRALRPFLVLDCRVHSADSLERELFGPSAAEDGVGEPNAGRLASCAGGTLLLKNVDTLPLAAQKKLLSVPTSRAGGPRNGRLNGAATDAAAKSARMGTIDVRLLASTYVDLESLSRENRFHSDLLERLKGTLVRIPSLADRVSDIGILTEHLLNRLAVVEGKPVKRLSVEALKVLCAHGWPGNLRELENVMERACSLDDERLLTAEMIRPWIAQPLSADRQEPSSLSLREMERKLIETTFARCRGNREQTARVLKIGIRTLSGKLREYGYPPRGGPDSKRGLSRAA